MATRDQIPDKVQAGIGAGLALAAVACAAVVVSHIFGRLTYALLLPAIQRELFSSYTGAGTLGASYFAGYLFGVIAVTVLSARIPATTLMKTGLGLSALSLAAMGTSPNFGQFATALFFAGLAGAGIWVPAPGIATAGLAERHRGTAIGALTASMGIGFLIVGWGTATYRDAVDNDDAWRPIFGAEAGATALILLAAVVVFARVRIAPDRPGHPVDSAMVESGWRQAPGRALAVLRAVPAWRSLTVAYTLFAVIAGTWTQFLGLAMDDAGWTAAEVTALYSVLAVAGIPGPVVMGAVSDRIGRDRAFAIAAVTVTVASLLVVWRVGPAVVAAAALGSAGSYSVPPLTAAAVRDHLHGADFGTAFGAMTILYAAASLAASQLAGVLADAGGFGPVYASVGAVAFIAGVVAWRRHRELTEELLARRARS